MMDYSFDWFSGLDEIFTDQNDQNTHNERDTHFSSADSLSDVSVTPTSLSSKLKHSNTLNLPPSPEKHYADKILSVLNSYDIHDLYQCLREVCTPDVKISKRVYSLSDPHMREKGLQDTCFKSIEEFVCFMEVWNAFIPDGVFSASNHETIVACLPTFVFICKLHFTGRKTVRTMNFFLEERLECYYPYLPQIVTGHGSDRPSEIRIEGSMTIFVNEVGLINKIEFYLTEV
mmetsp:Transcript_27852/g.30433  ORF Transcript_27852/g.30433 Transcript_27852/m.30433 type:complete len:231 (+) Transcript_27852:63-755(+)